MKAWFTLKKVIAILAILFIMYMFVGFFFWHYVIAPTVVTEGQQQIFSSIQPFIDFFKPATDFWAWAYDAFLKLVNGK